MPSYAGSEYIPVRRITRHGQIVGVAFHKQVVQVLVVRKEAQTDGAYIETGIYVHPWIIAHFGRLLGGEHTRRGA